MTDFRQRMITGIYITTVLIFVTLALLLGNILDGYFKNQRMAHYKEKLELVASQTAENGGTLIYSPTIVGKAADIINGTISFYSATGKQIGSTNSDDPNNSLSTESVKRLKAKKALSYEEQEEFNSYILPVYQEDLLVGFIELQRNKRQDGAQEKVIWMIISLVLTGGLLVFIFISYRLADSILKPINNATEVAKELAKGNFKARTYDVQNADNLHHSINILARNLERMTKSYEIQQERLKTLIENMGSGLILVDEKGYVELVNKSFKETFRIEEIGFGEELYYDLLPHEEVVSIIEELFLTEKRTRKQLYLPFEIERKYFDIHGAPILGNDSTLKGIVLVFHDITELKNLEQMRKDFVANVSHELKTPITSLKGFAETLLEGAMDNKEVSERFLTIIWKESDRLQHIIEDLLDLSKIEQQGFILNWEKVHLSEVLDDIMLLLQSKAEEKGISLTSECVSKPVVEGDPVRIRQIFINIINNSLTYTPAGGRVSVFLREKQDVVEFKVKDNGIGMSKEELPRIFERFYRIDKARSRNSGGTGLGLAIVKHLVEALNGQIHLESEKGIGTTFIVTFKKEKD